LRRRAAPVAHDDLVNEGDQKIVEPLGLRALLEHDMNLAAHSAEGGAHGRRRRHNHAGHYVPLVVAHRDHRGCLMDVETDILA
jgi:hypothetical protein